MKKNLMALLMMCCLLSFQGMRDGPSSIILKLADLTEEELQYFFNHQGEGMILECTEGVQLPLCLSLQGSFIQLEANESVPSIRILRTFYMRMENGECLFSLDRVEWKPFLEFMTGQFF